MKTTATYVKPELTVISMPASSTLMGFWRNQNCADYRLCTA